MGWIIINGERVHTSCIGFLGSGLMDFTPINGDAPVIIESTKVLYQAKEQKVVTGYKGYIPCPETRKSRRRS